VEDANRGFPVTARGTNYCDRCDHLGINGCAFRARPSAPTNNLIGCLRNSPRAGTLRCARRASTPFRFGRLSFASGCRQRDNDDASANCQGVFKYRDSQIRRIAAEPLSSVITAKGSCDGSDSTEKRPLCQRCFRNAVDCRSANRSRHNARREGPWLQSTRCKGQLISNQFAYRKVSDSFRGLG